MCYISIRLSTFLLYVGWPAQTVQEFVQNAIDCHEPWSTQRDLPQESAGPFKHYLAFRAGARIKNETKRNETFLKVYDEFERDCMALAKDVLDDKTSASTAAVGGTLCGPV